jgi:hypothetical protein
MAAPTFGPGPKPEELKPLEHEQSFDDRKLIVRQFWFFPPVCFLEPPKHRQRFYDRIVDIGQKAWEIEEEEALFGGICVIKYKLTIDYQPTVAYAERNFLSLDDLHKHLQERFRGPITAVVRRELKALSPELFAAGTGTEEVRTGIEKGINDLFRRQEIRCQTSCALKPGAVEFPKEDDATIILHKEMFRLITKGRHDYFEEEKEQELEHQGRLRGQKIASDEAELAFQKQEQAIEYQRTVEARLAERQVAALQEQEEVIRSDQKKRGEARETDERIHSTNEQARLEAASQNALIASKDLDLKGTTAEIEVLELKKKKRLLEEEIGTVAMEVGNKQERESIHNLELRTRAESVVELEKQARLFEVLPQLVEKMASQRPEIDQYRVVQVISSSDKSESGPAGPFFGLQLAQLVAYVRELLSGLS